MGILIPIKEASQTLNITIRAIQIKCKKQGITKIGNQYQITNDILNDWIKEQETKSETKSETKQKNTSISHTKQNKLRFANQNLLIAFLVLFLLIITVLFYVSLADEISYLKNENKIDSKIYKDELKAIQNRLNDAHDVIQNQEIEIQVLKYKDSMQKFKFKD
jgi:ABC-type Na+ efflux pump permease subunit